ncbi:hypothetical protein T11_6405 [Trichinella zimbabwensis]|uniref:Uncharacterized protein n=1 Tax=Trichinella zimbabwensis TaxID=268475 RepID=A0A0V1HWA1_9BILA|nr:hypothetical protein T11_6405 [Trichinella zimbabwensis]
MSCISCISWVGGQIKGSWVRTTCSRSAQLTAILRACTEGRLLCNKEPSCFLTFNRKPKNSRPHAGLLTQQLHASTSAVYPSLAQLTNNSLIGRKQAHRKDALYLQRQFSYNLSTCDL